MQRLVRLFLLSSLFIWLCGSLTSSYAEDRDPTTIVREAYQDILGRNPDAEGMRQYRSHIIDDGWSEKDVRNDLKKSPEYKKKDADRIIRNAYQDLLGRNPDNAGMNLYRNHIIDDGWSEEDVRNNIRNSDEYKRKH